jgi:hypothetical protein
MRAVAAAGRSYPSLVDMHQNGGAMPYQGGAGIFDWGKKVYKLAAPHLMNMAKGAVTGALNRKEGQSFLQGALSGAQGAAPKGDALKTLFGQAFS